jgi:uncharacterized protein YbjT (DUF2867 family)
MRLVVVGATGLVGRAVMDRAAREPDLTAITAVVRRDPGDFPTGCAQRVIVADLAQLSRRTDLWPADAVICALGTTRRKAGSDAAFRAVDLDLVVSVATAARDAGVPHFLLVSSLGADAQATGLYLRTKGEAEARIAALGFSSVTIVRPSLLLGERREFRLAERVGAALGGLAPAKWRPIEATQVALALVRYALAPEPGVRVVESDTLQCVRA